jgi:D-glycerate 3-kinase
MSSTSGQVPNQGVRISRLAEKHLRTKQSWSGKQRLSIALVAASLITEIPSDRFSLIGLSGAPGTGKSSLAHLICTLLNEFGTDSLVISLDDYYLSKQQRSKAAATHPLFAQRGVPGTHDWSRLVEDLDKIRSGEVKDLRLPRFDKMKDDRVPFEKFIRLTQPPRVVFLEGWLIGAPPQTSADLCQPVNQTEALQDSDGRWRKQVNETLARYHHDLDTRLDARWVMAVPGCAQVIDWRWQQEQESIRTGHQGYLNNRKAVSDFLDQFQRIAQHMCSTCRQWADIIINIDQQHQLSLN